MLDGRHDGSGDASLASCFKYAMSLQSILPHKGYYFNVQFIQMTENVLPLFDHKITVDSILIFSGQIIQHCATDSFSHSG